MPPRKLLFAAPLLVIALILVAACGGDDDDDDATRGQLSDPNNVPTATVWQVAPDVVLIDPNNIQPLPPSEGGPVSGGEATPAPGEPGVCGQTYTVEAGDTTFGIADKCGVSVEGIEAANPDIDIRALTIGDILIMPNVEAAPEEEVAPEEEIAPEEETPAP